ncbi:taste receptor type 2 member 40-like [Hyla sarda]|uniref:taste receptor type 2 member 40-like n=1 Tax=Hyla sarda TaxID=327740 RepID=UPI0024C3B850|nr:taste receptor type 2 member 40-like [Hyla sarda]
MDTTALVIMLVSVLIEFVVGMALNLHILLVYIGNLKNGLSMGPSDKIHITKALINISVHVMMTAQYILVSFWPHMYFTNEVFLQNGMINMFLIYYTFWLTALLCVYYCTNITTCSHHIFVWLKRSLSSYLLHILLVSGLGLLTICIPIFWFGSIEPPGNITDESKLFQGTFSIAAPYRTTSSILGFFLPLAIAFVSTAFTSWSLLSHMWRMKQNNPGFTRSKFQTQINATRTMILFLLICVIFNVIQMFIAIIPLSSFDTIVIVTWFVNLFYPLAEAAIIIQSSAKLRNSLIEKFFNKIRKNSETET